MTKKVLQVLPLAILFLASGCSTQLTADKRFVVTPVIDNSHPRATLVTASEGLVGNIKLLNPIFKEVGRMTQAQVRVQNITEYRYTLEYKFSWEDKQGFAVGNNNVWQRLTLVSGQTQSISSVGKTPDAKMIIFTVRLPDDTFMDLERREAQKR